MARMLSEAVAAFTASGVPVAHVRFRNPQGTPQAPPYATAYLNGSADFRSDGRNARALMEYDIILHTRDRDLALEASVEDAMAAASITWSKAGGYAADVDLVTTTYTIQVFER